MSNKKEILVNKIGLSESLTESILKISNKHSIWIANQIVEHPQTSDCLSEYKMIIDWIKNDTTYNIKYLNYFEALNIAKREIKKQKEENLLLKEYHKNRFINNIYSLKNRKIYLNTGKFKWVKLKTISDCQEEGYEMFHCLKNYSYGKRVSKGKERAYSLRDIYNRPFVTISIGSNSCIENIFSKYNGSVDDEHIPYVVSFLSYSKRWKYIQPNYNVEPMCNTIWKILIYCIYHEKIKLLNKIINSLNIISYKYIDSKALHYSTFGTSLLKENLSYSQKRQVVLKLSNVKTKEDLKFFKDIFKNVSEEKVKIYKNNKFIFFLKNLF